MLIIAFAVVFFLLEQTRFVLISLATAIILFSLTSDVINFIANIGSIVATALITLVAQVELGDGSTTLAVFVIVGIIQFVNGSIIDPMLMGRLLRLSSFGIILSVPIMVMLLVVCSHVPKLRPFAALWSREGLPESKKMLDQPIERDLFGQDIKRG